MFLCSRARLIFSQVKPITKEDISQKNVGSFTAIIVKILNLLYHSFMYSPVSLLSGIFNLHSNFTNATIAQKEFDNMIVNSKFEFSYFPILIWLSLALASTAILILFIIAFYIIFSIIIKTWYF